ncbi:hypothetical protein BB561_000847 [Smittium simulii]|uniref:Reverse transcriptase domain-containing protein n=1 Tax=Smittium simulii TaxID=133385 RepID=A0A2T9YXH2_9FUNG|nr:hypothetical protein BB561_000847 [Smittium simulii]
MSNVPGVSQSAGAELPLPSAKRARLKYSTACYGGPNKKLGVTELNSLATLTHNLIKSAEKCMSTPIFYNGVAVEFYQTITLEEGAQIITIPNTNSLNIINLVEAVNNTFTKNGIIYDFSAYKNKISGKFHTFGHRLAGDVSPYAVFAKNKVMELKDNKKNSKNTTKIGQNIVDLAPKSALETTIREVHNEIAPHFKPIKDSAKPTKLQSLELNSKNDELILKENIDWLTDINSTKQPEKINLELPDQSIYADSSCPSTLNFKKEWGNDHENYTENNVTVAVIDINFINELENNNGITDAEMLPEVKVNGAVSDAVGYKRGVCQGSQALKMLFSICKNDTFKDMNEVSVPGIKDKVSGLLFADNAIILAESADELQKSFDILTE